MLDNDDMYPTAKQATDEFRNMEETDHLNARKEIRHLPLKEHAEACVALADLSDGTREIVDEDTMALIVCFLVTPYIIYYRYKDSGPGPVGPSDWVNMVAKKGRGAFDECAKHYPSAVQSLDSKAVLTKAINIMYKHASPKDWLGDSDHITKCREAHRRMDRSKWYTEGFFSFPKGKDTRQ